MGGDDGVEVVVDAQLDVGPVVEPRASQIAVFELEPEGTDEVQPHVCAGAKAADAPGVSRDFGRDEDHVQRSIVGCTPPRIGFSRDEAAARFGGVRSVGEVLFVRHGC